MSDETPCTVCRRRPQLTVVVEGERLGTGRCAPCNDAWAGVHAKWTREREERRKRNAEVARRERDGLPKVGGRGGSFG